MIFRWFLYGNQSTKSCLESLSLLHRIVIKISVISAEIFPMRVDSDERLTVNRLLKTFVCTHQRALICHNDTRNATITEELFRIGENNVGNNGRNVGIYSRYGFDFDANSNSVFLLPPLLNTSPFQDWTPHWGRWDANEWNWKSKGGV